MASGGTTRLMDALREELRLPQAYEVKGAYYTNVFVDRNGDVYIGTYDGSVPPAEPACSLWRIRNGRLDKLATFPNEVEIVSFASNPRRSVLLLGGHNTGFSGNRAQIFRSTDDGKTWTAVYDVTPQRTIYDIQYNRMDDSFWAATWAGNVSGRLIQSLDGGLTWQTMYNNPVPCGFHSLLILPDTGGVKQVLLAGDYNGYLYRSTDAGSTWALILTSIGAPSPPFRQLLLTAGFAVLAIDDYGYIYKSIDWGANWRQLYRLPINTGGYSLFTNWAPIDKAQIGKRIYITSFSSGGAGVQRSVATVYCSDDEGETWQPCFRLPDGHFFGTQAAWGDNLWIGERDNLGPAYVWRFKDFNPRPLLAAEPLRLWTNKTVAVAENTDFVVTLGHDKKTFYLISNVAATVGVGNEGLFIQAYDEVAGDYKTIDSLSVLANTLTPYMTTYGARRLRLRFVPHAAAVVSAWCLLE